MAASPCIQCRIDPQLKARLRAMAGERGLTESALIKRLIIGIIGMAPVRDAGVLATEPVSRRARVYVRLRPRDHAPLRERAAGRGLASATYVSMLVRSHLLGVSPLPDRELAELRHAACGVGAVGRNLNQIARVAHQTGRIEGLTTGDLRAMLKAFEALRAHFKRLIEVNIASWETGDAAANRSPREQRYSIGHGATLRFDVSEACHILRMSRAQLYHRIGEGAIKVQKDGARTYFTADELERYVKSCDARAGVT